MIALFRASDIPARYVAGEVGLPIKMAENWVGVTGAEKALEVFSSNGIPVEPIKPNDKIIGLKFYHVWVEAYNEQGRWIEMDPSFKQYAYYDGINVMEAAGLESTNYYEIGMENATIGDDNYIANYNFNGLTEKLRSYQEVLKSYFGDATVNDIIGYREITNKAKGILPPLDNGGVFGISEAKERFSEIPGSLRYRVNFQVPGINYTVSIPEIAEKSVVLSYVPSTDYDEHIINIYGGIFSVPAFIIRMKPILKIDGEAVAEGSSITLGMQQTLNSSFLGPEEEVWDTNNRILTVGATYSLNLDIQRTSLDLINKRRDLLADFEPNQEAAEELLHLTGMAYFTEVNRKSDIFAGIQDIVWTKQPGQAIVSQEINVFNLFGIPWSISQGARSIDVKRNNLIPIGDKDNVIKWMAAIGIMGSATENTIFESLYEVPSVSTIKVLALANNSGVPIYTIDSNNIDAVLPQLNTFQIVKNSIRGAVENGWIAICPQRNITLNDWTGQGWIIADPATGGAGYLLAGSLVSGMVSVINGGSGSEASPETITGSAIGDFIYHAHHWGEIVMTAGLMLSCLYAMFFLLMFGGIFAIAAGGLIFLHLIFLLSIVLQTLLHEEMPIILPRRREPTFAKQIMLA